jgi:hypothetical protein
MSTLTRRLALLAALLGTAGRAGGVANPRDGARHRCGSRLASAADDGPLGRVQLPFLG